MAIDTPAKIAIFGAGPLGLEAALYARFLGYEVAIYERGRVAENVLRWGHVRLFSPFAMNRSPLALAALQAQDAQYAPPDDDQLLTGRQWAEQYLVPLSKTDLLVDHLHLQCTVLSVGRHDVLKGDAPGDAHRADSPFRILLADAEGHERIESADVVIDTSGVYGNHNCLGQGGIPAIGEIPSRSHIEYELPDVLGSDRERYAGRHTLLIGGGYSAAATVVSLAKLAEEDASTRVTWITRRELNENNTGPLPRITDDRLAERDALAEQANRCAGDTVDHVTHWPGTTVGAVTYDAATDCFQVELHGTHAGSHSFDRIIANVGYRPDDQIYQELQVHQCYASEGPMKLAASLLGQTSADCLDQTAPDGQTLLNPEPNFYILGAKSYGRNSRFLFSIGLEQIRQLFAIIGDREDLNLYAPAPNLSS